MPKKVDHDARRGELAAAVLAVIERDGMDGATIRGVAAEAGWTRGVIAHYFDSRDDLLLFAYREGLARTTSSFDATGDKPPLELLRDWLFVLLPLDPASQLNLAIYLGFAGNASRRPTLATAVEAEGEVLAQLTRDLFARCIDDGSLCPPMSAELAADVLITFVDGLGLNAAASPGRYTDAYVRELVEAFLDSWRPKKA